MKIQNLTNSAIRSLTAACCLALLLGIQAFAENANEETRLQQPSSIAGQEAATAVEQDAEVTPAGCADACCGDTCCGNGGCCGNDGCCGNGCCGNNCCCEAVCCPKKVTEEVKKHYWEVKSEMICIPGFRFECNWRKNRCRKGSGCCSDTCCNDGCCGDGCCGDGCCCSSGKSCEKCPCYDPGKPTCGRVRCIKVLEKHDYTCDKCGYEWEVKCIRSGKGCCPCGKGGCCCPSCGCASKEAKADLEDVQLTAATEATPSEETEKPSLARRLMPWLK